MKLLTINSSGRGGRGHTATFLASIAGGARAAGAEVQNLDLANLNIRPCSGCLTCWFRTPGRCQVPDDLSRVHKAFLDADTIIFGTPMYLYGMNGRMKNMLERLLFSFTCPEPILIDGRLGHHAFYAGRRLRLVLLCTGSFDDPDMFQPTFDAFAHMCRQTIDPVSGQRVFDHVGKIVVGFSELLLDKSIRERAAGLLEDLARIGKDLAGGGPLTTDSGFLLRTSVGARAGLDRAESIRKYAEIIKMVKLIYA